MKTHSTWAQTPIKLTESLADGVWTDAGKMPIPGGFLLTKNDGQFLYVALDMVEDKIFDAETSDYFWFTLDKNCDGEKTTNGYINYDLYSGFPEKTGRQFYLSTGTWTGLSLLDNTNCKMAFEASPNEASDHRIWKLRFKLSDLNISLSHLTSPVYAKFGIKIYFTNSAKHTDTPVNFYHNFSGLHTLYFSRKPSIPESLLGPIIGSVGLIPVTKINTTTGTATTDASYMVPVFNAAFEGLLNIIGNSTQIQSLSANGAKYIKVLHSEGLNAADYHEYRNTWHNFKWSTLANEYMPELIEPDSLNIYELQDPAIDFSLDNLLIQIDSNKLRNGIHNFKVKFYNYANEEITTVPDQTLTLMIDNSSTDEKMDSITHRTSLVEMSAYDELESNFDIHDPVYNMLDYDVIAEREFNEYTYVKESCAGVQHKITSSEVRVPSVFSAPTNKILACGRTTNGYSFTGYNKMSH